MKSIMNALKIALFLLSISSFSQASELWFQTYNGPGNNSDSPTDIKTDNSGNVIVTGSSMPDNAKYDIATIKYNSQGVVQWVQRYSSGWPMKMLLDPNGYIYIAGTSSSTLSWGNPVILKYDFNGNLIWDRTISGTGIYDDIKFDNSGNIVAAGTVNNSTLAVKYSTVGTLIWTFNYSPGGSLYNEAEAIAVGASGTIYLTGVTQHPGTGGSEAFYMKVTGSGMFWLFVSYNGPGNANDDWRSMTIDASENIYVCGTSDTTYNRGATAKYDSFGIIQWVRFTYSGSLTKICLDASNNVYVSGSIGTIAGTQGAGVVKYDNNGNLQWSKIEPITGYHDFAENLRIDNSNNVYLSGAYIAFTSAPAFTQVIKFSANGDSLWSVRKTGANSNSSATGNTILSMDNQSNIYLATTGFGSPASNDYNTVKYGQGLYTVSGQVTHSGSGLPLDSGYVKALYYDVTSAKIVTVDSVRILPGGNYVLPHIPQDSLYIMVYQNDDELDFVPTYYTSTTNWSQATKIYATQNLTGINVQAFSISNTGGTYSIGGTASANSNGDVTSPLKDAMIYVQSGITYKNFGMSNTSGNYTADKLTPGSYNVTAYRIGYNPATQNVTITNANLTNINFNFGSPIGIEPISSLIPKSYNLHQNYPNPFNPETRIKFDIPNSGNVKITIYDIAGRVVNIIANEELKAGSYEVKWDGSNYSSGIYFYRIETPSFVETRKMILLK